MASNIDNNEDFIILNQIRLPQFNSIECIDELRILLEEWGLSACFGYFIRMFIFIKNFSLFS